MDDFIVQNIPGIDVVEDAIVSKANINDSDTVLKNENLNFG